MAKNSPAFVRSPRLTSMALLGTLTLTAMFAALRGVKSQQRAERTGSVSTLARPGVAEGARSSAALENDNQYRIGSGDQLTIQVFNRTQLSREERVDMRGMIRMPLIEKDIQAACRTENELAEEIARLYRERDLLKNPTVYVAVKDFQSQPVAVLGAVNSPGKFLLQRRVRLLELVVFHAGGPSAAAGRKVQIVSTVPNALCEDAAGELGKGTEAKADASFTTYNLTDLLAGKESANPYVRQGDIINLPAAKDAYVIGNVARPSAIPIAEPITLGRALAMVGGPLAYTNKDKIRIIRESPGSTATTEILIDLKDVDKSKGQDFLLQAGDIVEVSIKGGFSAVLRQLTNSIVPMAVGLPTRVVY